MPDEVPVKHKGAYAELIACQWLLKRGYEVFRNISQHGIADIVAIRGNEVLRIDVKSASATMTGRGRSLKPHQVGVVVLYVFPDDRVELELSPRIAGTEVGKCLGCGKTFTKYRNSKFCSRACYQTVWLAKRNSKPIEIKFYAPTARDEHNSRLPSTTEGYMAYAQTQIKYGKGEEWFLSQEQTKLREDCKVGTLATKLLHSLIKELA